MLMERGLFVPSYWYWIGVGALCGYILLFNVLYTLALTYLKRKFPKYNRRGKFPFSLKISKILKTNSKNEAMLKEHAHPFTACGLINWTL